MAGVNDRVNMRNVARTAECAAQPPSGRPRLSTGTATWRPAPSRSILGASPGPGQGQGPGDAPGWTQGSPPVLWPALSVGTLGALVMSTAEIITQEFSVRQVDRILVSPSPPLQSSDES